MLGALDPLWLVADIYRHTVKVRGTPSRFGVILCIVPRAFVMAFRAFELNVLVWSGMNENSFLLRTVFSILRDEAIGFLLIVNCLRKQPQYRKTNGFSICLFHWEGVNYPPKVQKIHKSSI